MNFESPFSCLELVIAQIQGPSKLKPISLCAALLQHALEHTCTGNSVVFVMSSELNINFQKGQEKWIAEMALLGFNRASRFLLNRDRKDSISPHGPKEIKSIFIPRQQKVPWTPRSSILQQRSKIALFSIRKYC